MSVKETKSEEKYSIWLMPRGDIYAKLSEQISKLSHQYSTPDFQPHVTLIGNIVLTEEEALIKASELSSRIMPFEVRFTKVECLQNYFRSLFFRIEETEHIMDANMIARSLFNQELSAKYMPHLSLMYSNFDFRKKRDIIKSIPNISKLIFLVKSIHIFSTNGEPQDWYRVREFDLG